MVVVGDLLAADAEEDSSFFRFSSRMMRPKKSSSAGGEEGDSEVDEVDEVAAGLRAPHIVGWRRDKP